MIRRLILAAALSAGLAPAFAQVPPPVPALPDTERRTSYNISASTCACAINFALYGDSTDYQNWVEVFLNGVRVNFNDATFGWTITSPSGSLSNLPRPITNAVLTFANVQTGTVQIVGARRPRRTSQFQENLGVPTRNFNVVLSDLTAQNRELWDKTNDVTGRALISQPGNTMAMLPLPSVCSGKFLGFDVTGLIPRCMAGGAGSGNVVGPSSAGNGNVAIFDGTSGALIRDGGKPAVNVTGAPYLADPTGVADSTSAITAAIATGQAVYVPTGTYKMSGGCPTISTNGQKIYGDSRGATLINSTCTGNTFTIANGTQFYEFHDMTITRTGAIAVSGQDGIHCNTLCDEGLIENVSVTNHFNGFRLAGAGFAKGINLIANNNQGHGIDITNADGCEGLQWTLVNVLSQQNNGDGVHVEAVTCGASVGEFLNLSTFANKGKGARFTGQSLSIPLQGPRMIGGFLGQDCDDEIFLDTFASTTQRIEGVFLELAGTSVCGVNLSAAATNVGHGLLATANNTEVQFENSVVIGNSFSGISSFAARLQAAGNNLRLNGAAGIGGEVSGIAILAGIATITGNSSKGQVFGLSLTNDNHVVVGNDFSENTTASITAAGSLVVSTICANLPSTAVISCPITTTPRGDANYTISAFDDLIFTNAAFTAARTFTLPAANTVKVGKRIRVVDFQGTVTASNTLTIARAGSDTVNAGTSVSLVSAFSGVTLESDGASRWTFVPVVASAGGSSGQIQFNNSGVLSGFTQSGDCTTVTSTGVTTCTKTSGVSFGALATVTPGTGVATALGVNTGSAGAFVVNGGALGTPSSATLTNASGLPLSTGVTGTLPAAQEPAHTGDCTNSAGSLALTCLKTSNVAFVASATTDTTNASNITSGTLPPARLGLGQLTNSLGADVALNNSANFFDGPSVAQGSTGTWFASGTVTFVDTGGGTAYTCKLWDGTTVIASSVLTVAAANFDAQMSLSGFLASPAGNIRISCRDIGATTGKILFNVSGLSKDSTISAFRIN